ncbi:MAG: uroporphyrinogen-III synthase [Acidobacteria bacterium]|nr:uroporphyrinogen-III synthase [Acidobacteriota bacterium]
MREPENHLCTNEPREPVNQNLSTQVPEHQRTPSFQGLTVLLLESRRSREMAALVTTYGGRPVNAPALREVPLDSNPEALAFADALIRGEFDIVILLTGVGTRALLETVEGAGAGSRDAFVAALAKTKVVARGPKPLAVLRELKVPVWVTAPEPNTWRVLLAALDDKVALDDRAAGGLRASGKTLSALRVAVQEYGVSNPDLLEGLVARGALVTRVPVYRWALPEDLEPLRAAVRSVALGEVDVSIFTTGMQVVHLMQVAGEMGQDEAVRGGLRRMVVASIGPTTSEALRQQRLTIDLEASHPKMGFLVREAAERSPDLLRAKRPT